MKKSVLVSVLFTLIVLSMPAGAQVCGDADGGGTVNVADPVYLINYIFFNGPGPIDLDMANVDNCDEVDVVDVAAIVDYLFAGGFAPDCEGTGNCTPTVAGSISLDAVSGSPAPGQIATGQPITFYIRFTNETASDFRAFSNGLAISSPDGAQWGDVAVQPMWLPEENFNNNLFYDLYPATGSGADTVALGGLALPYSTTYPGIEAGFDEVAFAITIGPFEVADVGKTICLDSAFFDPAGTWKWTDDGTSWTTPTWDGPYCFEIVGTPTASITLDHVDGLTPEGLLGTKDPVTFYLRVLNNTAYDIMGMDNSFKVYSPGSARWHETVGDTVGAIGLDLFDLLSMIRHESCDGAGADSIQFGNLVMSGGGLYIGFDDVSYAITIGPIDPVYEGEIICLDSASMPPGGQWIWSSGGGNISPWWSGPHCFVVGNTGMAGRLLEVTPDGLNFAMLEGAADPAPQSFTVLEAHGDNIAFTAEETAGWFDLSDAGGTTPSTITVNINSAGLTPGVYENVITVSSAEVDNSPLLVTVRLTVVAGDHDGVSLASVVGVADANSIYSGMPVTFFMRFANASLINVQGFTNSFHVYSPDGAEWTALTADTIPPMSMDLFETVLSIRYFGVTGAGADSVFFGGAGPGPGLEPGYDAASFSITIGPIDASHVGKTICLDSCFTPPTGYWQWASSANSWEPPWDGPHCFTIAEPAPDRLIIPSISTHLPGTQPVACEIAQPITGASIPIKIPEGIEVLEISRAGLVTEDWDFVTSYVRADSGFLYVALANSFEEVIPAGHTTLFNIRFHMTGAQCGEQTYIQWDTTLYDDVMRNLIFVGADYLPIFPGFDVTMNTTEVLGIMPADFDGSGQVDVADVVGTVNFMFHGGEPPVSLNALDVNGDCRGPDVSDLVYMVQYHFHGGLEPACGCVEKSARLAPELTQQTALNATYHDGVTTIELSSEIDLYGVQFELVGAGDSEPVSLIGVNLDLISGATDHGFRVGVLDLDGGEYLRRGQYQLVRLEGEYQITSAVVTDMEIQSRTPLLNQKLTLVPDKYELYQNYPNPFNPNTEIGFALPEASHVKLDIYNIAGQRVTTLVDALLEAKNYLIEWNGTGADGQPVASGVYLYRLDAGSFVETKKMMLLK